MSAFQKYFVRAGDKFYKYDGGEDVYSADQLREIADELDARNEAVAIEVLSEELSKAMAAAPYLIVGPHACSYSGYWARFSDDRPGPGRWQESGHGDTKIEAIIEAAKIFTEEIEETERTSSDFLV